MIFAAGKGTRLKPLTDVIPKALVPVGDKPLLQIVMQRLVDAGTDRVIVNVHHHAGQIKNMLGMMAKVYPCDIRVSDETEELLETGGGIKKARQLFRSNEPVLIHNCDILSNLDLSAFYRESAQADAVAALVVSERKTQRYLLFNKDMRLVGWTNIQTGEVKSPFPDVVKHNGKVGMDWGREGLSMYAFSGMHCLSPKAFPLMDEWPDRFPIMDFYLKHCADVEIKGVVKSDLKLLDVGKLDTLAEADKFID